MLPDGAHLRTEDWTVFFLNQTIPDPDKITIDNDPASGGNNKLNNKKPLLYALNLVRTKHDKGVRRWVNHNGEVFVSLFTCLPYFI